MFTKLFIMLAVMAATSFTVVALSVFVTSVVLYNVMDGSKL